MSASLGWKSEVMLYYGIKCRYAVLTQVLCDKFLLNYFEILEKQTDRRRGGQSNFPFHNMTVLSLVRRGSIEGSLMMTTYILKRPKFWLQSLLLATCSVSCLWVAHFVNLFRKTIVKSYSNTCSLRSGLTLTVIVFCDERNK